MIPVIRKAFARMFLLDADSLILGHLFTERCLQDFTPRRFATVIVELAAGLENKKAPVTIELWSLMYPVQMLPGDESVMAQTHKAIPAYSCCSTHFNRLISEM